MALGSRSALRRRHRPLVGRLLLVGLASSPFLLGAERPTAAAHAKAHAAPYVRDPVRLPIGLYLDGIFPSACPPPCDDTSSIPPVLSQTGAFTDVVNLIPNPALIPFTMNQPLWSDGALKTRWAVIPNDGVPYDDGERVWFSVARSWMFPAGIVFVKHFALVINEVTGQTRRLETRFLVLDGTAGGAYGLTYKWRDDQLEADLMEPTCGSCPVNETYTITTATGTRQQTYSYPSRQDCVRCHNRGAGGALGVRTEQLNGSYPGVTTNQVATWSRLGILNPTLDESLIPTYLRLRALSNTSASLESRVRSYLAANCSYCHRPGGEGPTWNGRFSTPLPDQGILGTGEIVPGDLANSRIYQRMNTTDPVLRMPPLLRNEIHIQALQVLQSWIMDLCTQPPVFGGLRRAISRDGSTIELSWADVLTPSLTSWCGSAVTYSIYRDTSPSFTPSAGNRIAESVTGSPYIDTDSLAQGTTYYYIAHAVAGGLEDTNAVVRSGYLRGSLNTPQRWILPWGRKGARRSPFR